MTEVELRAFMVESEQYFVSMLRKFGAETKLEKANHEGLLAGFKDGMMTMARMMRDRGMLVDAGPPALVRTVPDLIAETRMAKGG